MHVWKNVCRKSAQEELKNKYKNKIAMKGYKKIRNVLERVIHESI